MKLVPRSSAYRQARREAEQARETFLLALRETRERLRPRRLRRDAVHGLRRAASGTGEHAVKGARQHPFIIGGVLTGTLGLLLRRPIMALSRRAGLLLWNAWRARRH